MLMFNVSDPESGDVELEVNFDDEGMNLLARILREAKTSGHTHIWEDSDYGGLTIDADAASPIKMVTFRYDPSTRDL